MVLPLEAYVNREYTIISVIFSLWLVDIVDRTTLPCYITILTPKSFVRTHNCR